MGAFEPVLVSTTLNRIVPDESTIGLWQWHTAESVFHNVQLGMTGSVEMT